MSGPIETAAPELAGHRHLTTLDLKDKRAARVVQLLFILIAGAFAAAALLLQMPLASGWGTWMSLAVTLVACMLYMWAHEATHGVLLTAFSGHKSRYALRLPYLTTGNDAFVGRGAFLIVTLGPLVLWGVLLLGLFVVVPTDARLTVYILSALNIAGSAGDLLQARWVTRLPADARLRDNGNQATAMVPERATPRHDAID